MCCRVRPQNAKELAMATAQRCVVTDETTIEVKVVSGGAIEPRGRSFNFHLTFCPPCVCVHFGQTHEGSPQKFTFDHVFGEQDNQKTVFESVALPVVQGTRDTIRRPPPSLT